MTRLSRRLRQLARQRGVSTASLASSAGIPVALAEAVLDGEIARPSEAFLAAASRHLRTPEPELRGLLPLRLREAANGSHEWIREVLYRELTAERVANDGPWCDIVAVYDDYFVVSTGNDKFMRRSYSIGPEGVTLGEPMPVTLEFVPGMPGGGQPIAEAVIEDAGATNTGRWAVRVIRSGVSQNGVLYPPRVLAEAAPGLDGVKCYAVSNEEHLRGRGKDVRSLIGRIARPVYAESEGGGAINAELELIEPESPIGRKLFEARQRDMTGLMGLSIYGSGQGRRATLDGRTIYVAESLTVESVDLVVDPSAGGEILRLIESEGAQEMRLRDRMINAIVARLGQSRLDAIDRNDDEQLELLYREATAAPAAPAAPSPAPAPAPGPTGLSEGDVGRLIDTRVQLADARAGALSAIAASGLPAPACERLRTRFAAAESIAEGDADRAIGEEREYLRSIAPAGIPVTGLGDAGDVRLVETRQEKVSKMLDALLDPDDSSVISIKETYRSLTGDARVTGAIRHCDRAVLAETIQIGTGNAAGVLAQVFGDSVARRMQMLYRMSSYWDWWEQIVTPTTIADFRTQHRIYWGGYGDLPVVGQSAKYAPLASPTDTEETFAVQKRGGLESVTLEAIKNDDLGQIQQIPIRLARTARRTLSKFVAAFFTMNSGAGPAMGDGNNLFHSSHKNRGTAALSAATVAAGRLAMLKQAERDSAEQLAIMPRYILVPWELQETASNLFRRDDNNDPTFVNALQFMVVPVPSWTDANDWVLVCDPMDCPVIEIGFLDGMREPELFVQSSEQVGSLFDSDEWTYKVRHIYGGSVLDWRGLYKAVVA